MLYIDNRILRNFKHNLDAGDRRACGHDHIDYRFFCEHPIDGKSPTLGGGTEEAEDYT